MDVENPSAFPVSTIDGYTNCGMDLRDWFAGQVMERMISLSEDSNGGWDPKNVAHGCYDLADAMLAARKPTP